MDTYFGAKPRVPRLIDLVREREIKVSMVPARECQNILCRLVFNRLTTRRNHKLECWLKRQTLPRIWYPVWDWKRNWKDIRDA